MRVFFAYSVELGEHGRVQLTARAFMVRLAGPHAHAFQPTARANPAAVPEPTKPPRPHPACAAASAVHVTLLPAWVKHERPALLKTEETAK